MKALRTAVPRLCAAMLSVAASGLVPAPAGASIPVFDAANYTQNIVQAARALEQINHQLQALQNQSAMLSGMARNLESVDFPELGRISDSLRQIDRLMAKAKGIEFSTDRLEQRFESMFPGSVDRAIGTDARAAEAKARLESARDAVRHSMTVQARIVSTIRDDARLLSKLSERSDGAAGNLQAQQATNQLLALSTKQQLQLQEMLAAQYRSQSFEQARRVQAEAEARAATRRFLGSGKAYNPGD